jgi:ATPase subunit of ABC transporter with duplicated ATPase domains
MLEEALDEYGGAVIAVSHDRRFLTRARVDRVIAIGTHAAMTLTWHPGTTHT